MNLDPRVIGAIVVIVVVVWLGLIIASALDDSIKVPAGLNTICMGVVGSAVAMVMKGKKPDKGGDE